jgi:hypothetical protein
MNCKQEQNEASICWHCWNDSNSAQSILTITRNALVAEPEPKRGQLIHLNLQLNQIRGKFCYNLDTSPHLSSPQATPHSSATLISAVPGTCGQQLHPAPSQPCHGQRNSVLSPLVFRKFCFHIIHNCYIYLKKNLLHLSRVMLSCLVLFKFEKMNLSDIWWGPLAR